MNLTPAVFPLFFRAQPSWHLAKVHLFAHRAARGAQYEAITRHADPDDVRGPALRTCAVSATRKSILGYQFTAQFTWCPSPVAAPSQIATLADRHVVAEAGSAESCSQFR